FGAWRTAQRLRAPARSAARSQLGWTRPACARPAGATWTASTLFASWRKPCAAMPPTAAGWSSDGGDPLSAGSPHLLVEAGGADEQLRPAHAHDGDLDGNWGAALSTRDQCRQRLSVAHVLAPLS